MRKFKKLKMQWKLKCWKTKGQSRSIESTAEVEVWSGAEGVEYFIEISSTQIFQITKLLNY